MIGVRGRSPLMVVGVPLYLPNVPQYVTVGVDHPDFAGMITSAAASFQSDGITASAKGSASPADKNAMLVVDRAGTKMGLTQREKQYAMTVARGEGHYGLGWKAGEGAGSHNWGAVQGTGPAGAFQHKDTHADGSPYVTNFKAYNNDDEGFSDMARILLKPNVRAILNKKGSLHDAVYTQHSNGYFELAPDKYLSAVVRNYDALAGGLGWTRHLSEKGSVFAIGAVSAGAAIGAGFLLARRLLRRS